MRIYDLSTQLSLNRDLIQAPNLTDRFSDEELTTIGQHTWEGYNRDQISRMDWLRRNEAAMDLAMQVQKDKNFPWPNCSNVIFPLVTIAALQFSSRSYSNIVQGLNVVKYRTAGLNPSKELLDRAKRIGGHMSWQVLEEDSAWEDQHDKLLINLGIVGCNFIKPYFKPSLGHNVSELVMARDLVIDYWAKSVNECARKTHIIPFYRNDIYERVRQGIFKDVLNDSWFTTTPAPNPAIYSNAQHDRRIGVNPSQPDEDTPYRTLEQHRWLDLDKDGYNEPYIVTIEETSRKVLRITSRIEKEEDIERVSNKVCRIKAEEYFVKFGFIPAPDGSIYDVGFGTLLGPLNEGVNTAVNQIFDVGTMMASNGGFLGRGAKIRGGSYTFAPWEWKRVDSTGDDLRKSMVQLQSREPSTVMFQMLGLLINYTDRLAGTVDSMVGENPGQNTKTGVSNNTLEQGMQVFSSIFKRVWGSMKTEFAGLYSLNRRFLRSRVEFGDKGGYIYREDYNGDPNKIAPVADPRLLSDTQRVQQAQVLCERSTITAGYDPVAVERNFLEALRIDGIEQFYPGPEVFPPPPDPKAEVMKMKLELDKAGIEIKAKQVELEKLQFIQELEETRRLNTAKIAEMQANAVKLAHDASLEKGAHELAVFETAINAFVAHNKVLTDRITAMSKKESASESSPA